MEEEQIRAPASYEQVPCLKLLSPYWKREDMQTLEERICEGGNAVYMRATASHIRGERCRIYEISNVVYARQAASHIRSKRLEICEP